MNIVTKASCYPWLVVGLLWVVACLNYIDRSMLATMRGSLVAAIPMSDTQFGLLSSVFLWVYGLCSPLAGFLADRFKRSQVIVGSLLIWSVVTWLTARAESYEFLLVTRALLGISEACYVPAALALITDFHRGTTRSLATGMHMTGLMIGASLGGLGGLIAEHESWNFAFHAFGLAGIGYALVLTLLLREAPPVERVASQSDAIVPMGGFGAALGTLVRTRGIILALSYWGVLGLTFTITGWMPTYLTEKFNLSQGVAGMSATGYEKVGALVGVLIGGYWADRWSRTNPRSRILVPVFGLLVSAPAFFVVASTDILALAVAALFVHGLTRAFTDANMMPILCLISDPRYRATAYGLLNFCGSVVAGLSIYAGGVLRDSGVPLHRIFQFAALGLFSGIVLLLLIRTGPPAAAAPSPGHPGANP